MEKNISNAIIKEINSMPCCFVRKRYSNGSSGTTGWPDITGSIHGIRLEIESKQPGKKPTKLQYSKLRKLKKLGCIAFWTDNKAHAISELLRQYDEIVFRLKAA